jgi:hypothetical protein
MGLCFRNYCNCYMKVRTASDLRHSDTGFGLVANQAVADIFAGQTIGNFGN